MIFTAVNRSKPRSFKALHPLSGKLPTGFVRPLLIKPEIDRRNAEQQQVLTKLLSTQTFFEISFAYSNQKFRTKVLRVTYGHDDVIFKVALAGTLNPNSPICWLQYQKTGWSVILGTDTDERLISAITGAIADCQG